MVALGLVYAFWRRPAPAPETERARLWDVEMLELEKVAIALPRQGLAQAWVRRADKHWYFDGPAGLPVSNERWGGGVPAILSSPRATRTITADASDEQLSAYGLREPRMTITLDTDKGRRIAIEVGDPTPTGRDHYLRLAASREIHTVDRTWYDVLERLVVEPPYTGEGR